MTRVLWIADLSIALLVFCGFPLFGFVELIYLHRMTLHAVVNLFAFGLLGWMIADYLLLKIREPKKTTLPSHDTPDRI
ncbi:MAG TPA: hypothetical protein VGM11_10610 [Acidobacteriaceae bacterium]|jgi:hypothetical protein